MLDNDPRYLRPESRAEMDQRITSLSASTKRRRRRKLKGASRHHAFPSKETILPSTEVSSTSGSSRQAASFDVPSVSGAGRPSSSSASPAPGSRAGLKRLLIPRARAAQSRDQQPRGDDNNDSDSDTTSSRIQNIRRRVSDCSTNYARQISVLLRDFTISSGSDLEDSDSSSRRPSVALSESAEQQQAEEERGGGGAFEAFPEPGFALPGDFLTAHTRNCADFPGQDHGGGGTCWCSIAQETSSHPLSWLTPTGELSHRARRVLDDPSERHLSLRDCFNNTPLHLFAALEGYRDELFAMALGSPVATRCAVNTGSQTFLHVLNVEWFTDLSVSGEQRPSPLKQLLAFVRDTTPSLLSETDVYGRTFFHRAHSLLRDQSLLTPLLSMCMSPSDPNLLAQQRRDAFGFSPLSNTPLGGEGPYLPPRRPGRPGSHSPPFTGTTTTPPPPATNEGAFVAYHARLVQVIQSAYTNPRVEDAAGRNGLHCLAEAILHQQAMDSHRSSLLATATGRPPKRKADLLPPESPASPTGSGPSITAVIATGPTSTSTSNPIPASSFGTSTTTSSATESPLVTRLRHLEGLLSAASTSSTTPQPQPQPHPQLQLQPSSSSPSSTTTSPSTIQTQTQLQFHLQPPTPIPTPITTTITTTTSALTNHYTTTGTPPIQAFTTHLPDSQDDKSKSLSAIFDLLLRYGCRLELRNRQGETALLVAARQGRKTALTMFLERGANVHARDCYGRGILEIIDDTSQGREAKGDVALYARLEACRVLLTGRRRDWGVLDRPGVVDEWIFRE